MKQVVQVIPAILESELSEIKSKLRRVRGLVDTVQIDICDGEFVPSTTYAYKGDRRSVTALINAAKKNTVACEFDMMVNFDCTGCMTRWSSVLAATKPDKVVFHMGSTYRWDELFTRIRYGDDKKKIPFTCGLAVRIDHTRAEIRKTLESHSEFEYIQLMGIERVGHSGQKLSPKVFDRITKLRRSFPDMPIQIDGGVKESNALELINAGATLLGMNSGIYKTKDISSTIEQVRTMG